MFKSSKLIRVIKEKKPHRGTLKEVWYVDVKFYSVRQKEDESYEVVAVIDRHKIKFVFDITPEGKTEDEINEIEQEKNEEVAEEIHSRLQQIHPDKTILPSQNV